MGVRHPIESDECFALLDDRDASAADRRSRLYTGYLGVLQCDGAAGLPGTLNALRQALEQGCHAVGLFSYELGAQMQGISSREDMPPTAQILLFSRRERLSAQETDAWLAKGGDGSLAGIAGMRAGITEEAFRDAIARIRAYIEAGDSYQVNYTYRLHFDAFGSPKALYRRLRARQPVPYGACIRLPDGGAVLSLSPELFVRHEAGILTMRPMKGTAPASGDAHEDEIRSAMLAADVKNRAENLMIVDLLRNDLGRIARLGTVEVPQLFDVSRHGSVLQMTSTVRARLREDATLADIFAALYPCGSITGAPKRRTMQIIRELEPEGRGIYTGAIGWFEAPAAAGGIGDFALSVPIRTLGLQLLREDGVHPATMGVGAGIVHDSDAAGEYAECALKAGFLTGLANEFELFETMFATREGCRYRERHLLRLRGSAAYFGFAWDEGKIAAAIDGALAQLLPGMQYRLRLALKQQGECAVQYARLAVLDEPVRLLLASHPTLSGDLFLRHKTSVRAVYDAAWRTAQAQGAFDMLFFNERGELTEGGRSNVFLKLQGQWLTPPLSSGVLPGVMRAVLLGDPAWNAAERKLTLDDLRAAEEVVVCNALRGALAATVDIP